MFFKHKVEEKDNAFIRVKLRCNQQLNTIDLWSTILLSTALKKSFFLVGIKQKGTLRQQKGTGMAQYLK